MDGKYYNLWSTDNERIDANDDKVIKSMYDPSPVGYSLPASNAFTGFTTTGGHTTNPAKFNVKGNFDKGWYFYTKPGKAGSTVFFTASGLRGPNLGNLGSIKTSCFYWMSSLQDTTYGRYLYFTSNDIRPINISRRSASFAVRSAEEKKWRKVDVGWRELQGIGFFLFIPKASHHKTTNIYNKYLSVANII